MIDQPRRSNENELVDEENNSSNNVQTSGKPDQRRKTKTFVQDMLVNFSKMWQRTIEAIDQILDDFGAYIFLDRIAKQLAKHPFLAFGVSALILSIALPFLIFMMFAIATVIITFFGFVIVEGTLITVASVLLFGFLGSVVVLFLVFGSVLMAGYFGFMQIYDLVCPQNLTIKFHQANRLIHHHTHHQHHHNLPNNQH